MAKSKLASAREFLRSEKQEIYKRDKGRCIFCGSTNQLTYMHFVARSRGGLGIVQNGALGCWRCHRALDNPLGKNEVEQSKKMKKMFRKYLEKYYPGFSDEERKYRKWNLSKN